MSGWKSWAIGEVVEAGDFQSFVQDQVVQTYADSAARSTALGTAVTEGMVSYTQDDNVLSVYTGSSWNTISQAISPNYIINGAFDIWQRGTSFSASAYTADRWIAVTAGGAYTGSYTRESFASGELPVASLGQAKHYIRATMTDKQSLTVWRLSHRIEDEGTLSGQTATVSFYAKADTTRSVSVVLVNSGGSISSSISVGTSWARYSATVSVPTALNPGTSFLDLRLGLDIVNGATYDIWGVQLEAGSVATPFRRNANSIQGELAACQRYYQRVSAAAAAAPIYVGQCVSTTQANLMGFYVGGLMRAVPTISFDTASNFAVINATGARVTATAISSFVPTSWRFGIQVTVALGLVAGNANYLINASGANPFIEISAEL